MKPLLLFAVIIGLNYSCKSTQKDTANGSQLVTYDNTCYEARKTLLTFDEAPGVIARIGDFYIITMNDGQKRLQPCKMPADFKREGLTVIFSGEQVEINPGERRFAMPLRLFTLRTSDQ
ncbi:MAG: hypothetical protein KJO69_00330 [Gammaproteobacteria bacterium]|nr:hypothetical protein [Gammaproteobacteria bacterium]